MFQSQGTHAPTSQRCHSLIPAAHYLHNNLHGNLKTEVIDVNLIDVPNPRNVNGEVAKRLTDALKSMTKRDVGRMVDESLMECHSYQWALKLAARPLALSEELRQPDRRQLDEAVFEVLGVTRAADRKSLVDRLYSENRLVLSCNPCNRNTKDGGQGEGREEAILDLRTSR